MSTATESIERKGGREGLASMIRRVRIRNYKSIKSCDVELGPLTILVGRNGSGKSNFLKAIQLISEGLRDSEVQRTAALAPWAGTADNKRAIDECWIGLEASISPDIMLAYEVCFYPAILGDFVVRDERLAISEAGREVAHYRCAQGQIVSSSTGFMPPFEPARLYLPRASAIPEFRAAYDALASAAFYDINPASARAIGDVTSRGFLAHDGGNLPSVFGSITSISPEVKGRILAYFAAVVPEVEDVEFWKNGPFSTLIFHRVEDSVPRSIYASGASDGTLRALGILTAINQLAPDGRPIRLVGIEEPETALHPAASAALMGALRSAAIHTQVLITTHGSDLLDCYDPEEDHLLLATMSGGATRIAPIDEASRIVLAKHLDTAGGLLRMDQFEPDPDDLQRQEMSARASDQNGGA